jgi:hypothetical protein
VWKKAPSQGSVSGRDFCEQAGRTLSEVVQVKYLVMSKFLKAGSQNLRTGF